MSESQEGGWDSEGAGKILQKITEDKEKQDGGKAWDINSLMDHKMIYSPTDGITITNCSSNSFVGLCSK